MDKSLKISIMVACLLAGFGVFSYYAIYLPDLEQRKEERQRAKKKEEAARRAWQERLEAAARADQERAKAEKRAQVEELEASQREAQARQHDLARKSAYYTCLDAAGKDYDANWANACKTQAKARWVALKNCLEDPNTGGNQFMGEVYCHSLYGGADPSLTCSLPSSIADGINKNHDKAKQQCLAEEHLS